MEANAYSSPFDTPIALQEYLEKEELLNNVPLGIYNRLKTNPECFKNYQLIVASDESGITGYAHHTPPHPLCIAQSSVKAIQKIGDLISEEKLEISGIQGKKSLVEELLNHKPELKQKITGNDIQGCYKLTKVIPTTHNPGMMRVATPADAPIVGEWRNGFDRDVEYPQLDPKELKLWLDDRIANECIHILEVGGAPVASAIAGRTMLHGRTIGFVYTPPEQRGKGYASQLVANLSQKILDEGFKYVCLFTQMSNPTSNKIYQNIGYEWIEEFVHYKLK